MKVSEAHRESFPNTRPSLPSGDTLLPGFPLWHLRPCTSCVCNPRTPPTAQESRGLEGQVSNCLFPPCVSATKLHKRTDEQKNEQRNCLSYCCCREQTWCTSQACKSVLFVSFKLREGLGASFLLGWKEVQSPRGLPAIAGQQFSGCQLSLQWTGLP